MPGILRRRGEATGARDADRPPRTFRAFAVASLCNLALIAVGLLVALGAMELAFRVAGIGSDQLQQQHPLLGVGFIPGKSGLSQDSCFRANPSINSHGWRSAETTWEKPEGVFRVLVLGDSFMAGLQVEDDETFAAALEKVLNDEWTGQPIPGRVETINLGVPSYGNDQEYLAFREFGRSYDPDLVLLAFFAQNDVLNNSHILERRYSAYPKPFFDVADGELVELPYQDPTPGWVALLRRAVQPLRIYPWVRDRLYGISSMRRLLYVVGIGGKKPREDAPAPPEGGRLPGRWAGQLEVYQRDYNADWEHAWDVTRALLLRTRDDASSLGADFMLVGVADPLVVIPPDMLARELPSPGAGGVDRDKPAALLRRFADQNGVDYVSLVPTFRGAIGDSEAAFEEYYYACDGHWTPRGHRLAAEAVAARMAPILTERVGP